MKKVIWIGLSYEDFMDFPPEVRHATGYALYQAQLGKKHEHTKVLSGMGSAGVLEIRDEGFRICAPCFSEKIEIGNSYAQTRD